jgi:hypothetical protein
MIKNLKISTIFPHAIQLGGMALSLAWLSIISNNVTQSIFADYLLYISILVIAQSIPFTYINTLIQNSTKNDGRKNHTVRFLMNTFLVFLIISVLLIGLKYQLFFLLVTILYFSLFREYGLAVLMRESIFIPSFGLRSFITLGVPVIYISFILLIDKIVNLKIESLLIGLLIAELVTCLLIFIKYRDLVIVRPKKTVLTENWLKIFINSSLSAWHAPLSIAMLVYFNADTMAIIIKLSDRMASIYFMFVRTMQAFVNPYSVDLIKENRFSELEELLRNKAKNLVTVMLLMFVPIVVLAYYMVDILFSAYQGAFITPFVIAMLAQVLVPIFGLRGVVVSKTEVHKKMMLGMAISFTVKILIVLTGIGLDTIFIVATANIAYQILVGVFSTYHIKNILGINLCLIKPRLAG